MSKERSFLLLSAIATVLFIAGCGDKASEQTQQPARKMTPQEAAQQQANMQMAEQMGRQSEQYATKWQDMKPAGGAQK